MSTLKYLVVEELLAYIYRYIPFTSCNTPLHQCLHAWPPYIDSPPPCQAKIPGEGSIALTMTFSTYLFKIIEASAEVKAKLCKDKKPQDVPLDDYASLGAESASTEQSMCERLTVRDHCTSVGEDFRGRHGERPSGRGDEWVMKWSGRCGYGMDYKQDSWVKRLERGWVKIKGSSGRDERGFPWYVLYIFQANTCYSILIP